MTLAGSSRPPRRRGGRFTPRVGALVACTGALAIAGCGSSSTTSKAKAPTASTPVSTAVANAYSSQLAAALTPVQSEFQALRANPQTAKQGSTWAKLAAAIKAAHDKIMGLTAPAGAAAIQSKLVSLLGAMAADAGRLGTDLDKHDQAATKTDLNSFQQDALKLQAFGQQLQGR
jgi:hypothetical protein